MYIVSVSLKIKIINGLGKLYPRIGGMYGHIKYCRTDDNCSKSWWVGCLCMKHLNQRIPSLEKYLEASNKTMWDFYTKHFGIEE